MKPSSAQLIGVLLRGVAGSAVLVLAFLLTQVGGIGSVASGYPAPDPTASSPSGSYRASLPIVHLPPPDDPSYYVTNLGEMENLGRALGDQDRRTPGAQNRLVVLAFGRPRQSGSSYGTYLVFDQSYTFRSTTVIATAAYDFAHGYWIGTGTDTLSHVRIVVGTSNCCQGDSLSLFQGHGTAWALMMASIKTQIALYSPQVDVVAGSDMETSFNLPYATTQWVSYLASATSASSCSPQAALGVNGCLYNFGTASSVLPQDNTPCANSSSDDWVACDVWYISWGITKSGTSVPFARPLPEIYHTAASQLPYGTDATQWKNVAYYSVGATYNTHSYISMYFVGSLTQFGRCGPTCSDGAGGTYGNNTKQQGYDLLYSALNSNTITDQPLKWLTDIRTQP